MAPAACLYGMLQGLCKASHQDAAAQKGSPHAAVALLKVQEGLLCVLFG